DLLDEQARLGRIAFTSDYREAVPDAEVVFICVGTPSLPDGQPDMSAVQASATTIGSHLGDGYTVVVNKSTVPIGSGDWVGMLIRQGQRQLAAAGATRSAGGTAVAEPIRPPAFDIVSNPEFLREGSAVLDALYPERIVVGSDNERALQVMQRLYQPILECSFA